MAYVHRVNTRYTDFRDHSSMELPALITQDGILLSHLRYLSENYQKSESWKERSTFSIKLLIEYIQASRDLSKATDLLRRFVRALNTGTINFQIQSDETELYWKPRSVRDVNNILFHITHYTDWLSEDNELKIGQINPFRKATKTEERLNWCAYYQRQTNVFLNHLSKPSDNMDQVRYINGLQEEKVQQEAVKKFPEEHIERLIYEGFYFRGKHDYRSMAQVMLMNYAGIRKSEI